MLRRLFSFPDSVNYIIHVIKNFILNILSLYFGIAIGAVVVLTNTSFGIVL